MGERGGEKELSEHTPGPFITVLPNRIGPQPHAWGVDFGDGTVVCTEHESRARLIAAAPELLEALKRAKDLFGELMRDEVLEEPTVEDVATFDAIDDAIAKAEGRE